MKNRFALLIEKSSHIGFDLAPITANRAFTSSEQRNEAVLEIMEAFQQGLRPSNRNTSFCKITFGQNNEFLDFIPDTPDEPVAHFANGDWLVAKCGLPRTLHTRFQISDNSSINSLAASSTSNKNQHYFPSLTEAVTVLMSSAGSSVNQPASIVDRFTGARFWIETSNNKPQLVADSAFAKEVLRDTLNAQRAEYLIGQAANALSSFEDYQQSSDGHSLLGDLLDYLGDESRTQHHFMPAPCEA